jgi:hypothetical protein
MPRPHFRFRRDPEGFTTAKPWIGWSWFCRRSWFDHVLDRLLDVPHWAPEGDFSLAARARE